MQINTTDASSTSGFYAVDFEVFAQTLAESKISASFDLGGGIVVHYGERDGAPVWLLDNSLNGLSGVWVEKDDRRPS